MSLPCPPVHSAEPGMCLKYLKKEKHQQLVRAPLSQANKLTSTSPQRSSLLIDLISPEREIDFDGFLNFKKFFF